MADLAYVFFLSRFARCLVSWIISIVVITIIVIITIITGSPAGYRAFPTSSIPLFDSTVLDPFQSKALTFDSIIVFISYFNLLKMCNDGHDMNMNILKPFESMFFFCYILEVIFYSQDACTRREKR